MVAKLERRAGQVRWGGCLNRFIVASLFLAALSGSPVWSADWPQFLGPQRNGISTETGLRASWSRTGPKELWRIRGNVGMSGIAVSGGLAVTLIQDAQNQIVVAVDAKTGKPAWRTPIAPAYENQMGNGPRATPLIAGDRVFVFSGEGILAALDRASGKLAWSNSVVRDLKGKPADYGMASSPLLVNGQIIVTAGVRGACVVACDAESGKLNWSTGDDPAGYSSPALLDIAGSKQVVVYSGASLLGVDPRGGKLLWQYPYVTDYECNIATPLLIDDKVFISSGENHGSVLLAVKASGNKFDLSEVWTSHGAKSVLRNEWQTSILWDGYLYGFDNVGSAGPVTHLTCIDPTTGERKWRETRFGKGNLIAADGKLFISTMKGELILVRADPERYEELGRAEVIGTTRQAPSLADGRLYLRDDREIVCFDVRAE